MQLRDKIKVEQLDEERVTNIERRLVVGVSEMSMRSAPASRGWLFGGASLAAVAAAAVIGWKLHTVAPVVDAPAPQVAQSVELDGIAVSSSSKYRVTQSPHRLVIDLQPGSIDFSVVHDPNRTLLIHAGATEIEDIGTKFHIDFDATSFALRVTEGEVKVTAATGAVVHVTAGNAWTTSAGLIALAGLDKPVANVASDAWHPTTTTTTPTNAKPTEHPITHRVAEVAPVVEHPLPAANPVDPYVELRTAIRKVPLELAPNIDGHSDAAAEIAKLKKIAYSPTTLGPEASQAMYQIAVLLYRPLGQDAEALRTLDVYTRRFTGGKEFHAALWLRVRIECSRGALDESCRRAAYSYQHESTSGEASSVAIRITNAQ